MMASTSTIETRRKIHELDYYMLYEAVYDIINTLQLIQDDIEQYDINIILTPLIDRILHIYIYLNDNVTAYKNEDIVKMINIQVSFFLRMRKFVEQYTSFTTDRIQNEFKIGYNSLKYIQCVIKPRTWKGELSIGIKRNNDDIHTISALIISSFKYR